MYDCNIHCLGPGCEFWLECQTNYSQNTAPAPSTTAK